MKIKRFSSGYYLIIINGWHDFILKRYTALPNYKWTLFEYGVDPYDFYKSKKEAISDLK